MATLIEAAKQALEALEFNQARWQGKDAAITALRAAIEQAEKQEPVAWDVFELRLYGAPLEKQHRVLWVDRYTHQDGSIPDLDGLLEAAKKNGGIDGGAKTLYVRPLYTTPPAAPVQEPVALENVYETIIHWDEGGGKRSRMELARRIVALYTTPPAAQQEPVAWQDTRKTWVDVPLKNVFKEKNT